MPLDFEFDNKKFSDFFSRNQNKVYVDHWTYGDFSVSDSTRSETYDDVEYYVVDSLKNLDRYRVMSFEMSDLRECE
ncbi:MAG: hypothetical protein JNM41_07305 [Flavipsychrobacter sp.]|nr:hypothetical protein [Flavipsychrobacter sp.]